MAVVNAYFCNGVQRYIDFLNWENFFSLFLFSMVFPKRGRENDQHGKYFETAHEHEPRQNPFDQWRQDAPRHCGPDFQAQRGADVAAATQGDSNRVGAVHTGKYHDKIGRETQRDVGEKKCHQGNLTRAVDGRVVDLDGQHRAWVQHVAHLVAQHLQRNDPSGTLEAAGRAAGTSAKEHAQD